MLQLFLPKLMIAIVTFKCPCVPLLMNIRHNRGSGLLGGISMAAFCNRPPGRLECIPLSNLVLLIEINIKIWSGRNLLQSHYNG